MRMRKKPNLGVRMERCTRVLISDPEERKGKWRELMPEAKEVFLELGCGKGRIHRRSILRWNGCRTPW